MPIFQTAHYQVEASAVEDVKAAIEEFVAYVAKNEPDTKMYMAWEAVDDPTKFVHLFEFADAPAHQRHGGSDAVAKFEAVYRQVLVGGPVSSPTTCRWRRINTHNPRARESPHAPGAVSPLTPAGPVRGRAGARSAWEPPGSSFGQKCSVANSATAYDSKSVKWRSESDPRICSHSPGGPGRRTSAAVADRGRDRRRRTSRGRSRSV